ncbi:MAG TPA: DUF2269 family protein, partial [Gemmatimonadaceae bacterium]|nr:DUF2269 family protein [Gemmatimonadaceae bacterium]
MVNAYNILKYIHVLSVIAWLGGVACLSVLVWRVRREQNRVILAGLLRQSTVYGQMVAGPGSGLVLLSGLGMVGMTGIGFGTFWVVWGYAGILLHFLIGAVLIRKRTMELARLASADGVDDQALAEAGGRLWTVQLVYLAIMALVV